MKNNNMFILLVATPLLLIAFWAGIPLSLEYGYVLNILGISSIVTLGILIFRVSEHFYQSNRMELIIPGIIILLMIFGWLFSSKMFRSDEYSDLIKFETHDVSKVVAEKEIRTISRAMAFKSANKIMGIKEKGVFLSSQYSIEEKEGTLLKTEGQLYWAFPLDYISFFKWLNQEDIPGYIIVSATDSDSPAKFIKNSYRIGFNGYITDSLLRIFQWKTGFKDGTVSFEINEEGHPYYIALIKTPTIGFDGLVIKNVAVIDAKTGATTISSLEDTIKNYPWIDNLISEKLSLEQLEDNGLYSGGYLNSIFTQENVKKPSSSYLTTISSNGELFSFTGMTSISTKDQSLVEGIFVNNKTGRATVLPLPEITNEEGAIQQMDSSLGADSIKWDVVLPQPLIVDGKFYWLGTVVSQSSIFQKLVAIDGNNVTKTFEGKNIKELLNKIKSYKNNNKNASNDTEMISIKKSTYLKMLNIMREIKEVEEELK